MKSLSKSQLAFYNLIVKFIWECKGPRIAKRNLKNKKKVVGFTLPHSNLLQNYRDQGSVALALRTDEQISGIELRVQK